MMNADMDPIIILLCLMVAAAILYGGMKMILCGAGYSYSLLTFNIVVLKYKSGDFLPINLFVITLINIKN
ncbi:hypothetical protein JRY02_20685 [Enterobacter roggenkampii]|nr:hypothetical protein [Enterobacter roggenkampii]